MADETVDLIEETSDEMENWIYYSKETKPEDNRDINSLTKNEAEEQQFVFKDSTGHGANNNEPTFQYECADSHVNVQAFNNPKNNIENEEQAQTQLDNDDDDDCLKHNLILRETIDENGQLAEDYFCQECNLTFNTIEDFLKYHPSVELLSENSIQQETQQQEVKPTATDDKLWDLVGNLDETENGSETLEDIIEMKPDTTESSLHEQENSNNAVELEREGYFCYDCQQVFNDLTTAENHDCINQLPESNSDLIEESVTHNVYRCHLCDKDYNSLRSFNNHQRWHKKSENLLGRTKTLHDVATACEICNTVFASEKNLKLHMKMHKKQTVKTIQEALPVGAQNEYNELNKFFCEICNKSFDQKLLAIHKNMHQNIEEYNCGKCNKQFENLPSYEIHMQMHVDNMTNIKKVIIPHEAPTTSAQSYVEGGKRKHACQYCGKEFQRPYEKVKHERIHTGEKPYECEVCGKTFRVSYSLTLHLRTHTDIRPYVCATCNKRFKQQSVYVHHLKTHVVERGYKCDICGKSFRTSVQLGGHKNIHSKPYNCTECNRPFASLYAVKIHMKTHNKCHKSNKNLKNRCYICGASYARAFALRFHIKEQHGIDVDDTKKLLAATSGNTSLPKDIDAETVILMNAAHEASNQQMHFFNADDDDEDDGCEDNADDGIFSSTVDHEENIQNPLPNMYLDETEAATQAILNTDEISVDNFPTEEIITDWISIN